MDDSWSKVCCRWANSLDLADVKDLMSLVDGKFFALFITKYIPWKFSSNTATETWLQMEDLFNEEFPSGPLIKFSDARDGHEEELVKIVSLFMYLGTVKYPNPSLSATLQDNRLFTKELQLRIKCILQALMEHHSTLTTAMINEILMAKVSETTGQLSEPIRRNRVAERSSAISRVAKPTIGSPVIFSSSGSPLKEFLDSPLTRQAAKHQRQIEDKNSELRELKVELDKERMEKQFLAEENSRIKQDKRRLETETSDLKLRIRDIAETSKTNDSASFDPDIADQYHNLLKEHKDQEKYLATVQQQLEQVEEEKLRLESRLNGVSEKLASANEEKISAELCVSDMKTNLCAANDENNALSANVDELKNQIDDLNWQIQNSFYSNNTHQGRKSFAPSIASVHLTDMTDVSMDADDSMSALGMIGDISENLGDVVGRQLQEKVERIEELERDKEKLEDDLLEAKASVDEVQKQLDTKKEFIDQMKINMKALENENKTISEHLDKERMERGIETSELRSEIDNLNESLADERSINASKVTQLGEEIAQANRYIQEKETVIQDFEAQLAAKVAELNDASGKLSNLGAEKQSIEENLTQEIEVLKSVKSALEADKQGLETQLEELKVFVCKERIQLEEQCQQLTDQLAESQQNNVTLQGKCSQAEAQVEEQAKLTEELQQNVQELNAHLISSQQSVQELEQKAAEYEEMVNQQSLSEQTLQQRSSELEGQLALAQDKCCQLESKCSEAERQVLEQMDIVETLQANIVELEATKKTEVESAEERLAALQDEKYDSVIKMEELEQSLKTVEQTRDHLGMEKVKLESEIAGLKEHTQNLKDQIIAKEEEVENLTNDMETQRKYHLNKDADLRNAQDKITQLEKKVNSIEEMKGREINNIRADLEGKCKSLMNLQKVLDETKQELHVKEQDSEKFMNNLTNASSAMGDMKVELCEAKDKIETMEAEMETSRAEAEQMRGQFTQLLQEKNEVIVKMEEMQLEKSVNLEKIQALETELTKVQEKMNEKVEEISSLNTEAESSFQRFGQLQQELKDVTSFKQDMETSLQSCQQEKAFALANVESLKMKVMNFEKEMEEQKSQMKEMEETLEANEQIRQEIIMEKQKLEETLGEIGANHEQKTTELSQNLNRIQELEKDLAKMEQVKDDRVQELQNEIEFIRSQLEEANVEKDNMVTEIKCLQEKNEKISEEIKHAQDNAVEIVAAKDQFQSEIEAMRNEKSEVMSNYQQLEEKIAQTEKMLEEAKEATKNVEEKSLEEVEKSREAISSLETQLEEKVKTLLETETSLEEIKNNMGEVMESKSKLENDNRSLQDKINELTKVKDELAISTSQMLTSTLEMKNNATLMNEKFEKEKTEFRRQLEEKQSQLNEIQSRLNDKDQLEKELADSKALNEEHLKTIQSLKEEIETLKKEMALLEIKLTDLEQENKGEDVKEALKAQKQRFEENHKKIVENQAEKYKSKMEDILKQVQVQVDKKDEDLKKAEKEKADALAKCEYYKKHMTDISKKTDEVEALNKKEFDVIQDKLENVLKKYEAAKMVIEKLNGDKENLQTALDETDAEGLKREVAKLKAENRNINNMLTYAETKLREHNKNVDSRPVTRSRESSIGSQSSLDQRSRDSIGSSLQLPRTSSRQSMVREDSNSSIVRARPSVPGRADRMSTRSARPVSTNLDDSIFKIPGPNTPGRSKTGRTVSDSRMKYNRPPVGAGNFFSCDEEAGEMFSNSYLMDLKEGACDVNDSGRMSELARRNTLCPPHLKSAYPVESQFCEDNSMTEDAIRQAKLSSSRRETMAVSSPATRMSKLSLDDSPAASTRSKRAMINMSHDSDQPPAKVPAPVAFNIDAPARPGSAVRKGGRVAKQACVGEHGVKKQACEGHHDKVDDSVFDDSSALSPSEKRKRSDTRSQKSSSDDLDNSQDSNMSTFSRSSVRSSKRLRGESAYNKPGPPTPGRRVSLGNLSLPKINTSSTSLETTQSYPGVGSNTPDMSRVSARSEKSLKTPLLDQTNTPKAKTNTSKLGKTPLNMKKLMTSAFRKKNKSYKMMDIQDKTIQRDQTNLSTPMKAKEKAKSPIKKIKI